MGPLQDHVGINDNFINKVFMLMLKFNIIDFIVGILIDPVGIIL